VYSVEIILSALPLVAAIVMLIVLQRSGLQASLVTLGVAIGIALAIPSLRIPGFDVLIAIGTGLSSSLLVLSVLFPALLLYQLQQTKEGMSVLAAVIARLCPDRDLLVLLIVLGLAPFVESVSGFGVGTVVVIPILIAVGFDALQAATLGLLGQIAVPWGALAVGTVLGADLTGLNAGTLGAYTALVTAPLPVMFGLVALVMSGGKEALRRWWLAAVVAGTVLTGGEWLFSQVPGAELAGVLASLLSLALLVLWSYIVTILGPHTVAPPQKEQPISKLSISKGNKREEAVPQLWQVIAPYVVLTTTLLISRLVVPLRGWLSSHMLLAVPLIHLSMPLLYTPGFWLLLAAFSVVALSHLSGTELWASGVRTWRQFLPGAVAITCFIAAGQVMSVSGMTAVLGKAAATLGGNYGWIAPWLGALGGWLTGSNAGGNAMFALLQKEVAVRVGLPLYWILGAQNGSGSIVTMASPARTILAATAAGLLGKESQVLQKVGPVVLLAIAIIMLVLVSIVSRF
jgi:lactate permease